MDISWSDIQAREDGRRIESPAFIPGVDFDPSDPEDVEIVGIASGIHRTETIESQRQEIARLNGVIATLTEEAQG